MNNRDFVNLTVGDRVEFGQYPQSIVTDNDTLTALKNICGNPRINLDSLWHDYDYNTGSGMYADIDYSEKLYRAVYIKKYRDEDCTYRKKRIYIFLYEPIVWRVLQITDNTAMLVCEKLIDGQEYSIQNDRKTEYYKNNYEHSHVRAWLNSTFIQTAFNDTEKKSIQTVTVCNAGYTTKKENNPYTCNDTADKVFLLSYKEAETLFADNKDRWKKLTEYAKSQGCWGYMTRDAKYDNGCRMLRSPDHIHENFIRLVGDSGGIGSGGFSCSSAMYYALEAVAPALYIKIK